MPVKKFVGSREWKDLPKIYTRPIRYNFNWEWNRPRTYLFLGLRETGKSNLNEGLALRHPHILDLYGSQDNENLCWCRKNSPIDDVLLVHGDNTDVDAPFKTKRASEVTILDINDHEVVTTCASFFSSLKTKYEGIQALTDRLYKRFEWKQGDIIYILMRETMNVIYARTSQGMGEKQAKEDLLYFIREIRHFGVSLGADLLRWTGVDKELRDLADFMIFKQIGEKGLPDDKRYLYNYIHPTAFAQMKPHQFVTLRKDGAIAFNKFGLLPFHKEEGVDLLKKIGIKIEYGEEPVSSSSQRVGDKEHAEIVSEYNETRHMVTVSKKVHRSIFTVSTHVNQHNRFIQERGYCPKCRRVESEFEKITIEIG
jgi:hypothetical protein